MQFNLTITLTATPELLAAINALAGVQVSGKPAKVTELKSIPAAKPEKTKPAKEEPKDDDQDDDNNSSGNGLTLESVTEAVRKKIGEGKAESIKKLLAKFKVPKASALEAGQYADFMDKLKAV